MAVTPWWKVLRLRPEVTAGAGSIDDVQMSLFNAVVGMQGRKPAYAKATAFGEITYPAESLVDLMAKVAVRLAGPGETYERAPALYRLDQGMGGGKSHGLIGLWHLAAHSAELAGTDVGARALSVAGEVCGAPLEVGLGNPQVVVLSCDNMVASQPDREQDGLAQNLYERMLWRLFGGDVTMFNRYKEGYADKHRIAEALEAVGRPVLILVDEILDYIRQLSLSTNGDLAVKDMTFLRALLDTVNDVRNVAMVVVMIASEKDSIDLDEAGQRRRRELEELLTRNGVTATVNSPQDFGAILRRRLFENQPPAEVITSTVERFSTAMDDRAWKRVFELLPRTSATDFASDVARCYPFHPHLLRVAEQEWATVAGFQKVRSTIKVFAATVHDLHERGNRGEWSPLLIGPGDLPLSSRTVREAIINSGLIAEAKAQANYRGIASADIVGEDDNSGAARAIDVSHATDPGCLFAKSNPRAAERAATALFLYSIVGTRAQGRRGAAEPELKAATFVPDASYGVGDADSVLAELENPDRGLASVEVIPGTGGQGHKRYYLTTRQTLAMWFRSIRASITDQDRDDEIAKAAERLAVEGPFAQKRFVPETAPPDYKNADLIGLLRDAALDKARTTRLVVLDPNVFSLGNGMASETEDAIRAASGIGGQMPMSWAPSCVYAIVNTQRRALARQAAADYVAWSRVCEYDAVLADEDLRKKATEERNEARRKMDAKVKQAFQHFAFVSPQAGGTGRDLKFERFELDNQSALDGVVVWARLVEEGRAVAQGQFRGRALVTNLRDDDYGKPLDDLLDLFWNSPRMPLLPAGERDLQAAIFEGVQSNLVRLVGPGGTDRVVTRAEDIGVSSASLRLAKPGAAHDFRLVVTPGDSRADLNWDAHPDADEYGVLRDGTEAVRTVSPTASVAGLVNGTTYRVAVVAYRNGSETARSAEASVAPHGQRPVHTTEMTVSFTVTAGLRDAARRDAVEDLLRDLASAVVDGASHVRLTVQTVVRDDLAPELAEKAKAAGAPNPTVTPI